MNTELQFSKPETAVEQAPSPASMLKAVIEKGITTESVAVIERLADLYERMEDRNAEKDFNAAFSELQKELPVVVAKTMIPNRGKYEKFEDLMETVAPHLSKHQFTVDFSQDNKDNKITSTCFLSRAGHTRSRSFTVRTSGKADSETQSDLKASKTAKRKALEDCLNIVIRQDFLSDEEDASLEGGPITLQQADELERRVKESNSDINAFLKVAQADSFRKIGSAMYPVLDAMLHKKEIRGR